MTRTGLDSLLQLVEALRKVENLIKFHTTWERIVARRAKEKCTKDSDFNPSVVNSESLVDTVIGVGESDTKEAQCWFEHEYMKGNQPQDALQKDIREWTNTSVKGQGHSQPKGKGKGRGKGKRKHPGKENHNQDRAGSANEETGQPTLGDFGIVRQRVEFVGGVQENDDFETPRLDRAAYVFCFQKVQECYHAWIRRNCQVRRRVFSGMHGSEEPAGTHENFDQSTGWVLFAVGCRDDRPLVDSGSVVSTCPVDYATSVPTEKVQHCMDLESVLGESLQNYGIKRNVPFTNRTGSTMNVNFEVTDTKRAILSVHKGLRQRLKGLRQRLGDRAHFRRERVKL